MKNKQIETENFVSHASADDKCAIWGSLGNIFQTWRVPKFSEKHTNQDWFFTSIGASMFWSLKYFEWKKKKNVRFGLYDISYKPNVKQNSLLRFAYLVSILNLVSSLQNVWNFPPSSPALSKQLENCMRLLPSLFSVDICSVVANTFYILAWYASTSSLQSCNRFLTRTTLGHSKIQMDRTAEYVCFAGYSYLVNTSWW